MFSLFIILLSPELLQCYHLCTRLYLQLQVWFCFWNNVMYLPNLNITLAIFLNVPIFACKQKQSNPIAERSSYVGAKWGPNSGKRFTPEISKSVSPGVKYELNNVDVDVLELNELIRVGLYRLDLHLTIKESREHTVTNHVW